MPLERLQIVLDENLPWSLSTELKTRGYSATSNYVLNASGLKDPEWLEVVAGLAPPPVVLVTYDNAMPAEHGDWLRSLGVALAVIDSRNRPADLTLPEYWREVVHRHAHQIGAQEPGSWWRYRRATRRRLTGTVR